jgi:ribonuclease III
MAARRLTGRALADAVAERIGVSFADAGRLQRALTHASAPRGRGDDYQRLEFLGDRVLGLVVAEMLFAAYPDAPEGELSLRLNQLVSAETCAAVAGELGLADFVLAGSEIRSTGGAKRTNLRADIIESLIAAIYLEGGLEAARRFIVAHWEARSRRAGAARRDPKTALQEWAHQVSGAPPVYQIVGREGPDHDPVFTVRVAVDGREPAEASGHSKREAEQAAAAGLLLREGVWEGEGETA